MGPRFRVAKIPGATADPELTSDSKNPCSGMWCDATILAFYLVILISHPLLLSPHSLQGPESSVVMSSDTGLLPFFHQLIFPLLTSLPALSTVHSENSFPL